MANNGKNSVTKAQAEAHRRTLSQLLRQDDNRRCADCMARGPTWASVNLGVFVCLNCSGVHRSLGTDLSKVRSTTLDTWLPEQVAFVQRMGNRKANLFWEGRLPQNFRRPVEGDMLGLRHFINDKYRDQMYALKTWDKPPTIETYVVHPFMKQNEGDGTEHPGSTDVSEEGRGLDATSRRMNATSPDATARRQSQGSAGDTGNLKPPESQSHRFGSLRRAASPTLQPPPRPAAAPPATPELFDLLSLNEPESAPSPSVQDVLLTGAGSPPPAMTPKSEGHRPAASQESFGEFGDTASSEGGWAAFVGGSTAASAATPAADDTWDAFQGGGPETTTSRDPFAPAEPAATPALENAAFQPKFPSAPSSPTPHQRTPEAKKGSHRPQRSAEEIMRMFDQPKQLQDNLFNTTFPLTLGGLPGSFPGAAVAADGSSGSFPGAPLGAGSEGYPVNDLWPPLQMPAGTPGHNDLVFPPQMFSFPAEGRLQFPDTSSQGGWATLPPMSGGSSLGGSTTNPGKGLL